MSRDNLLAGLTHSGQLIRAVRERWCNWNQVGLAQSAQVSERTVRNWEALGQRPARKWKLIVEKLEEEVSKKPERAAALTAALGDRTLNLEQAVAHLDERGPARVLGMLCKDKVLHPIEVEQNMRSLDGIFEVTRDQKPTGLIAGFRCIAIATSSTSPSVSALDLEFYRYASLPVLLVVMARSSRDSSTDPGFRCVWATDVWGRVGVLRDLTGHIEVPEAALWPFDVERIARDVLASNGRPHATSLGHASASVAFRIRYEMCLAFADLIAAASSERSLIDEEDLTELRREIEETHRSRKGKAFGRYEVIDDHPIATNFCSLYRARDTESGAEVAIKEFSPRYYSDPEAMMTLHKAIRLRTRIKHRSIVYPVGSLQIDADSLWFAMPWLAGGSLQDRLGQQQRATSEHVAIVVHHVADVLAAAHSATPEAIVHRDIHPGNILFADEGWSPWLTDWEFAAGVGPPGMTHTMNAFGRMFYVHDDLLTNRPASHVRSSDVATAGPLHRLPARPEYDVFGLVCVGLRMLLPPDQPEPIHLDDNVWKRVEEAVEVFGEHGMEFIKILREFEARCATRIASPNLGLAAALRDATACYLPDRWGPVQAVRQANREWESAEARHRREREWKEARQWELEPRRVQERRRMQELQDSLRLEAKTLFLDGLQDGGKTELETRKLASYVLDTSPSPDSVVNNTTIPPFDAHARAWLDKARKELDEDTIARLIKEAAQEALDEDRDS